MFAERYNLGDTEAAKRATYYTNSVLGTMNELYNHIELLVKYEFPGSAFEFPYIVEQCRDSVSNLTAIVKGFATSVDASNDGYHDYIDCQINSMAGKLLSKLRNGLHNYTYSRMRGITLPTLRYKEQLARDIELLPNQIINVKYMKDFKEIIQSE